MGRWLVLLDDGLPLDNDYDEFDYKEAPKDIRQLVAQIPLRRNGVEVRPATRADMCQVLALQAECLPPSREGPISPGAFVNHLFNPSMFCLVACDNQQPNILLGALTAQTSADRKSLYVSTLCTSVTHRHPPLVVQKELRLHVHVQNIAARALYHSLGFHEVATQRKAYRHRDAFDDALVLCRA